MGFNQGAAINLKRVLDGVVFRLPLVLNDRHD
jgi:hypothetical protein